MVIVMVANISKLLLCARNPRVYIFSPHSHSTYCARWEYAHCTGWEPEASRPQITCPDHLEPQKSSKGGPAKSQLPLFTLQVEICAPKKRRKCMPGRQHPSPQPSAEQGELPANARLKHQCNPT